MTVPVASSEVTWEDAGRRVSRTLDAVAAAVVVSDEPEAAALAALGLARAQAERRHVAIADLVGDLAPLQQLVSDDDAHGIVDSFLYGVSINRIARPADESGRLFILPSGTESPVPAEIFTHERWAKLAAGFREMDALLLIVARAGTPGLDALLDKVDGVVLAGRPRAEVNPRAPVLAIVELDDPRFAPRDPLREHRTGDHRKYPRLVGTGRPWLFPALTASALLGVAAAVLAWFRANDARERDELAPPPAAAAPSIPGSGAATATSALERPTAVAGGEVLPVANPGDSAIAARYTVLVLAVDTPEAARQRLDAADAASVPAATLGMKLYGGKQWFEQLAGAYAVRSQADSLHEALRGRRMVDPDQRSVVARPYALQLEVGLPRASAAGYVSSYRERGLPAYALAQADGTVRIYAGAFETPDQAALYAPLARAAGVAPVLAFRTGRPL